MSAKKEEIKKMPVDKISRNNLFRINWFYMDKEF